VKRDRCWGGILLFEVFQSSAGFPDDPILLNSHDA